MINSERPTLYSLDMARKPQKDSDDPRAVNSELTGFYRLPMAQRRARVAEIAGLTSDELRVLTGDEGLCAEQANHMVENALGVIGVPLALCVNLQVDGRDWLVPMAVEEASVVAAASHAAKLLRAGGGIRTRVTPSNMIGQIQLLDVPDPAAAEQAILEQRDELLQSASSLDPCLVRAGGGAIDIEVRHLPPLESDDPLGPMLVAHLIVDVREAMGANTVNSMCEHLAPRLEQLSGGRARLRIVSNLADRRMVLAQGAVPLSALEGKGCASPEDLARGIEEASIFAERDPYRAATHNKGIMNGVDGVLVAFGQDWRAVEAGAHAFAARGGRYTALSRWRLKDGALQGRLELPMPVGVVGGVTTVHPTYKLARKLSSVTTVAELSAVTAAVGLAQNLGALRALAAEGIQKGHMRVHARNVAVAAGAVETEIDQVAKAISHRGSVSLDAAHQHLRQVRNEAASSDETARVRERFKTLRTTYMPGILSLFDEVLHEASPDSTLAQMCRYHLQTGGKRLRALLPLLVAQTLGTDPALLLPFGAACEMLHNATLVHDDLQDGDNMRRGAETIWRRYGMAQAVNLGDAMFYYTLLLILRLDVSMARREAVRRRVLMETLRVIDGQEREFALKQQGRPTLEVYFAMVEGKTSGLFALPMAGAAALCGTPTPVVEALQEAARHMGVLFQIQDDLLDLYGDKGRDMRGSDIREGKRSVLVVHALQNAAPAEADWLQGVLDTPREQTSTEQVARAEALIEETGSLAFALDELELRKERARQIPALHDHQQLRAVVSAMCELFSEPIQPIIAAKR
jgi:hydroxymethylglutaryl-CoA reductase